MLLRFGLAHRRWELVSLWLGDGLADGYSGVKFSSVTRTIIHCARPMPLSIPYKRLLLRGEMIGLYVQGRSRNQPSMRDEQATLRFSKIVYCYSHQRSKLPSSCTDFTTCGRSVKYVTRAWTMRQRPRTQLLASADIEQHFQLATLSASPVNLMYVDPRPRGGWLVGHAKHHTYL